MSWITVLFLVAATVGVVSPTPIYNVTITTAITPSRVAPALTNTTVYRPPSSCAATCTATAPNFFVYTWVQKHVTETITAATAVKIINTRFNTTRYVTKMAALPEGVTLPQRNEQGTSYCNITVGGSPTTIAYPSKYFDYEESYKWYSMTPTTENGESVCSSNAPEWATFSAHPNYNSYQATYTTKPTITPGPRLYYPDQKDPQGLNYACTTIRLGYQAGFVSSYFPDEFALHHCDIYDSKTWGVTWMETAEFLTATSVSYEDDAAETELQTLNTVHIEPETTMQPTTIELVHTSAQEKTTVSNPKKPVTVEPSIFTSNQEVTETAHTERSATIVPPSPTSQQETAHTDVSVTILPLPPTSFESTPAFAHTERPSSPEPPPPTSEDGATASTILTVPIVTVIPGAGGASSVVTTHSSVRVPLTVHIESSVTKLLPPSVITVTAHIESSVTAVNPPTVITIAPTEHTETSAEVTPPSKTAGRGFASLGGAPPQQTVSIGSTAVVIIPTSIAETVDGTSTNVPAVVVDSSTLKAGQTITVDNTPIAVPVATSQPNPSPQDQPQPDDSPAATTLRQPPAIIIGGSNTVVLPTAPAPSPPALTIGGETIQPSSSAYIISGATLAPDSPITLGTGTSATVLAITTNAAGNSIILVGTSAAPFVAPASATEPSAPALTVAGQTVYPSGDGNNAVYIVAGHTLAPGSPVTLGTGPSATVLAITTDSAGNSVVALGTSTVPFAAAASAAAAPLVLGTQTITPQGDAYVVAGQTLGPGSTVTLGTGASATVVALSTDAAGARVAVVATGDGSMQTQTLAPAASATGLAPLTLLPGQTVAPEGGAYVVDGKTLLPGSTVTVGSGTSARTVALTTDEAGRTVAVEGGRTQMLEAGPGTTSRKSVSVSTSVSASSSGRRTTSAAVSGRPSGTDEAGSAASAASSKGAAVGNAVGGIGKGWGAGAVGVGLGVGLLVC